MDETNTQIAWPSKLKIGAKSKKGIHTHTDRQTIVTAEVSALVTQHKLTICSQAAMSNLEYGYIQLVSCCLFSVSQSCFVCPLVVCLEYLTALKRYR